MAKQLFKGFKQVLSGATFENGYIYLVREDESMENGYIYFNGKKYGTTKAVADELIALSEAISAETEARIAAVSAETEARETAIAGLQNQLSAETEARIAAVSAETEARIAAVSGLQNELETEVSALTSEDVVDVRYDSSAKTIYMEFKDGSVSTGFDASAFIIDGMLSGVTYDSTGHTMTFIWNTDAGHESITIDLDDVIAPYNADETTIHKGDNNTFSAIMDQADGVASYGALSAETEARIAAVSAETEARIAAVSAETEARETAISGLQNQLSAETEARIAAVSAETEARIAAIQALDANVSGSSNDVTVELTEVDGVITNITVSAPNAITALTVNEVAAAISGHSASVVIDAGDILLGADIPSGATSGQTVLEALTDIYGKLNESDAVSSDNSINVTPGAENVDFTLNRETATDATVAAGHLEIALNASGEIYAVMYYDGNDSSTPSGPPANEIWYTATEKITPYNVNVFGSTYLPEESTFDSTTGKGVLKFDGDVTTIGEEAFRSEPSIEITGLTSIEIPNSVTSIGSEAFGGCSSLTSVTIPNSVTSIGVRAFSYCVRLLSPNVPNSVTTIANFAFGDSSIAVLNIIYSGSAEGSPWGAKCVNGYIENDIVYADNTKTTIKGCSVLTTDLVIPDGVTTIGETAFYWSNLQSVVIPSSVTIIERHGFYKSELLKNITYNGTTTQWNSIVKGEGWKDIVPATVVHCTDGDVNL